MTRRVFVVGGVGAVFAAAGGVAFDLSSAGPAEAAADGDGDEVPVDKVPAVAADAVRALFPGAKFDTVTTYTDDKVVHYEVFFTHAKSNYEVTVTDAGTVIEVAKEIEFKDLPKAVAAAVHKKYPKGKIGEVAELTEPGVKGKHYHVELTTAKGNAVALTYEPDGKLVDEE